MREQKRQNIKRQTEYTLPDNCVCELDLALALFGDYQNFSRDTTAAEWSCHRMCSHDNGLLSPYLYPTDRIRKHPLACFSTAYRPTPFPPSRLANRSRVVGFMSTFCYVC